MSTEALTTTLDEPRPGSIWRNRNFLLLWSGQTINEAGTAVTTLALPLVAITVLQASPLQTGLLVAVQRLAFILFALPAGAIIDRLAKRPVMVATDLAQLALIGWIPLGAELGVLNLGQVYLVAFLAGACAVFFGVAYQSYLPAILHRSQLVDGNGKLGATQSFGDISGPPIGGALVALLGAAQAVAADALSYLASAVSLLLIRNAPEQPPVSTEQRPALHTEIREGISFICADAVLWRIGVCTATYNLFMSIFAATEILFMVRVLHLSSTSIGLLLACGGLGGIIGGMLAGRLASWIGSARAIRLPLITLGAFGLLIPLAHRGWGLGLLAAGYLISTIGAMLYNVGQITYRQAVCPQQLLGRVVATMRWAVWGVVPIGAVLGGWLSGTIGIRQSVWVAVIGGWLAGLWVLCSPLRRQRDVAALSQL